MAHMKTPYEYELEVEVVRLQNKLMLMEAQMLGDTSEHNVHHARLVLLDQVMLKIGDIRREGMNSNWSPDQWSIALNRALEMAALDYRSGAFQACPSPGCVRGRDPNGDQHAASCLDFFGRRIESKAHIKAEATKSENTRVSRGVEELLGKRADWKKHQLVNFFRALGLKMPPALKDDAERLDVAEDMKETSRP